MPDDVLKDLFQAAYFELAYARPRDPGPLRQLGDYYEEHGHMGCAHACRQSAPAQVPILSYLIAQGMDEREATSIRKRWIDEVLQQAILRRLLGPGRDRLS